MTDTLEKVMVEDRMVRDAARAMVDADLANLKANYAARGIGDRVKDKFEEGAAVVLEEAVTVAEDNKGVIATLIAAIILWFARHPVMDFIAERTD